VVDFAAKSQEFRAARTRSMGFGLLAKEAEQAYPHISASQLKTWNRCKRLWFFEKICKVRQPDKIHFRVGHVIHRISERYQLKLSKDWEGIFDAGWDTTITPEMSTWIRTMAAAAVEKGLWQAADDVLVEHPMTMLVGREWLDDRGLPWLAHADTYTNDHGTKAIHRPTKLIDGQPLPSGWDRLPVFVGFADQCYPTRSPPKVGDHKSAKHRGYATTPGKLAEDVQMLTYSAWMLARRRDVESVELQHNVFLKDKQTAEGAYPVKAVAELGRVRQEWDRVIEAAEGMQLIRKQVPVVVDPARPYARANQWQRVSSAIEEGCAKESCNAYGGCPFKDACHGRATAEQVLSFIEKPTPPQTAAIVPKPAPTFGLNHPAFSSALPKEAIMPFIPPKPAPAQFTDVFLLDPDNHAVQYRARQFPAEAAGPGLMVMKLWPHVDIEPKWGDLPPVYRLEWAPDQVSQLPYPTAKLTGYHEALLGAGQSVDECAWSDSTGVQHLQPNNTPRSPVLPVSATPPAVTVSTGIVPTAKPPNRPAADGAFGLAGTKVPPAPLAPPAPVEVIPSATFEAAAGQLVEVLPSANAFFQNLAGKQGKVIEVGPGEGGLLYVDVMLADGTALSDVVSGRFKLVAQPLTGTPEQRAMQQFVSQVSLLKGKQVQVERHSGGDPVRCILEGVTDEGLEALGGKLKVAWADVKGIGQVPADALPPGAPAPKPTAEEKAAAKAAKDAEKAAAKAAEKAQKDAEKAAAKAAKDAEKEAKAHTPVALGQIAQTVVAPAPPALGQIAQTAVANASVPGMFTMAEIVAKSAEVQTHLSNAVMAQNQLRNMLESLQPKVG
jgi:hypothetical protein